MRQIILPALFLLLLGSGCAPKVADETGEVVREKLYYDANLAFSVTVPETWKRSFITPPPGSPGGYSVLWRGDLAEGAEGIIELQVDLLADAARQESASTTLQKLARSHPGLIITGQHRRSDDPDAPLVFSGHTPDRQHQLMLIPGRQGRFQIELSAPEEDFAALQVLFAEILASFQPHN